MNHLNRAFRALRLAFQRREQGRDLINKAPRRARFSAPCIEALEDRTLMSANPALLDAILGDATGIAAVDNSRLSYLGFPAQITGQNQLTVFATGKIELSSFRPDYLQSHE